MGSTPVAATARKLPAPLRGLVVVGFLYVFLLGVALLEDGIGSLGSGVQEDLFSSVTNPLAGVFVGVLATVLAQSSSVTTATTVGLVGGGLIGVDEAIPIIMGANIGTTVTNTLVSIGSVRRPQEFRSAFSVATVHDFFNVLSVAVLLPLELVTGLLSRTAEAISERLVGGPGTTFESPLRQVVKAPASFVQDLWEHAVSGTVLGVLLIVTGLALIFLALTLITGNMRVLIASRVERSLNAMLGRGSGLPAIALGIVITIAVQSSTITTSLLVPLAAAGMISLRNAYPVSLGANLGTTITALLASLASERPEALTIALVHTLFNLGGILIFYPIPALRAIPITLADRLADQAVRYRMRVAIYVLGLFVVLPALGVVILR